MLFAIFNIFPRRSFEFDFFGVVAVVVVVDDERFLFADEFVFDDDGFDTGVEGGFFRFGSDDDESKSDN